jgi:hypothetical protein
VTGASNPFNIVAAAPAHITYFSGGSAKARQSTTVRQAFTSNLVATVTDKFGNPVPNVPVTFKVVPQHGSSALFLATGTTTSPPVQTDTNGQAIVSPGSLFANHRAGNFSVKATVAKVTSAALFYLTNVADVAVRFVVIAPAEVNQGIPFALTVMALDQYGNLDTNYMGTVHFDSTDSNASLPPDTFISNGRGTFSVTLGTISHPFLPNIRVSTSGGNEVGNPVHSGGVVIDVVPPTVQIPTNVPNGREA